MPASTHILYRIIVYVNAKELGGVCRLIANNCYNGTLTEQSMSDLAKKLGIKPGMAVCLLGAPPEAEQTVCEAAPWAVYSHALEDEHYDMILFWPIEPEALAARFAGLQNCIKSNGSIWAVMPKQKYAAQRGVRFTWEQMQAAGLQTDLVDNKVASITEQDYGTRFVIRKDRRQEHHD